MCWYLLHQQHAELHDELQLTDAARVNQKPNALNDVCHVAVSVGICEAHQSALVYDHHADTHSHVSAIYESRETKGTNWASQARTLLV